MSSALQSSVSALQQHNYTSLMDAHFDPSQSPTVLAVSALIAVGYDYVLVFPQEIEYIWSKPWTWVSTLFILVRYCGLVNLVCSYALLERNFVPGPPKMYVSGEMLDNIQYCAYLLFLGAADFVMILRVWAMHDRSKTILGVLVTLFSIEIISVTIALAVSIHSKSAQYEGLGSEYLLCVRLVTPPIFQDVSNVLQIAFGAVLCILAIVQFVRQSLQMYDATKQWQLNRYIKFLLQQGIVYFFVIFLLNLTDLLAYTGKIPGTGWQYLLWCILSDVPAYTLIPRFIISIREMHANDVQCRSGLDTGLGLCRTLSSCGSTSGAPVEFVTTLPSDIALEDVDVDCGHGRREEI